MELYERAQSEDKRIKIYPGAAHQLFMEKKDIRLDACKEIVEWIMDRIPLPRPDLPNEEAEQPQLNEAANA